MPGTILRALRRLRLKEPGVLIDEIDKMGSDFRGDPASAMLEVLDPEQPHTGFHDHYLDLPFDLSKTLFIYGDHSAIAPLLDQMVISGYTEGKAEAPDPSRLESTTGSSRRAC